MVAISDKFGKASSNTDYAVATTVKTTRVSGATVLEAFDLSKFATDAPVFFITYKKTTDPVTGIVSVTNQVSWKALVNSGANTLTNLTLAPGYTDTGNAPGDFIECVPTSYWENSLVDGILVSHNADGSLKNNSVTTAAIATDAVETAKIKDAAVTPAKRSGGFYVGNFSITATGTKVITGVGFKPKLLRFQLLPTTGGAANFASGTTDGTNYFYTSVADSGGTALFQYSGTNQILAGNSGASGLVAFTVSSMDADGFTLNVVTRTANTTWGFEAIA